MEVGILLPSGFPDGRVGGHCSLPVRRPSVARQIMPPPSIPPGFERMGYVVPPGPPPGFENIVPRGPPPVRSTVDAAYTNLGQIGQGSYGAVFRARNRRTGEEVAIKRVRRDQLAMREIDVLSNNRHPSLINLKEVVYDVHWVFLVLQLADGDLDSLIRDERQFLDETAVKKLMFQLLHGMAHLHSHQILHRDLKPQNLLLTRRPDGSNQLKICDLGLCKRYSSRMGGNYSRTVVTLGYRAPELLGGKDFVECSPAIDMWSVGCIMAELICGEPLFNGRTELAQYSQMYNLLGSGFDRLRQRISTIYLSDSGFDLLSQLLHFNPHCRISATKAIFHPWFDNEYQHVLDRKSNLMIKYPAAMS